MQRADEENNEEMAQQIVRLQRQVRHLINSLPIGIAIVDTSGLIEAVNPSVVSLFGYEGSELVGRNIALLLRQPPWVGATLGEWHLANLDHAVELEGHSKNEEIIPIEVTINTLDTDGHQRLAITVQDVTERFLANRLKADFFAMINHDIRSPLSNVALFLDLLEAEEEILATNNIWKNRIGSAKRNVQRIHELATGLLELDRLETGVGNLQKDAVSMQTLVQCAALSVAHAAAVKSIQIKTTVEEATVAADFARLEQVLVNLLSNAIAHSSPGKAVELKVKAGISSIRLSVVDAGAGVPDGEKRAIFEKHYQGSSKRAGGFGLGLAICKEIVRQHGGEIACADAPGGGSEFWFELPVGQIS